MVWPNRNRRYKEEVARIDTHKKLYKKDLNTQITKTV